MMDFSVGGVNLRDLALVLTGNAIAIVAIIILFQSVWVNLCQLAVLAALVTILSLILHAEAVCRQLARLELEIRRHLAGMEVKVHRFLARLDLRSEVLRHLARLALEVPGHLARMDRRKSAHLSN